MATKPQTPELHNLFLTSLPVTQTSLKLTRDIKQLKGLPLPVFSVSINTFNFSSPPIQSHLGKNLILDTIFLIQQI